MKIRMFIKNDDPKNQRLFDLEKVIKETSDCEVEILDVESREGKEVAEVYDIYAFPGVIATTDDGVVLNSWIGKVPAEFEIKEILNV